MAITPFGELQYRNIENKYLFMLPYCATVNNIEDTY